MSKSEESEKFDSNTGVSTPVYLSGRFECVEHEQEHVRMSGRVPLCQFLYTKDTVDRKSTRLNSSHSGESRMPSSA